MTSRRLLQIPPPTDAHDFDAKVADALRFRERNVRLIRYARPGQAQGGIDGWDPLSGPKSGIMWQAKLEQKPQLLRKLKADLRLLDEAGFTPKLFILATGLARDRKIQDAIAEVSGVRKSQGLCPVEVLFWDEIREIILSDDKLFTKHYSELVVRDTSIAKPRETSKPVATPKPPAEAPLPLVVTEASRARTVPYQSYQQLWRMLHLAKMCPDLSRSQLHEIEARLMTAEHGIESDGNWASGRSVVIGDYWNYPNGKSANIGDSWNYPYGKCAGTESALIPWALLAVDIASQRQVLAAFQALRGQVRKLALVQLSWLSYKRTKPG